MLPCFPSLPILRVVFLRFSRCLDGPIEKMNIDGVLIPLLTNFYVRNCAVFYCYIFATYIAKSSARDWKGHQSRFARNYVTVVEIIIADPTSWILCVRVTVAVCADEQCTCGTCVHARCHTTTHSGRQCCSAGLPDTFAPRHFGTRTVRHRQRTGAEVSWDTSAPVPTRAEVSGHFGTKTLLLQDSLAPVVNCLIYKISQPRTNLGKPQDKV